MVSWRSATRRGGGERWSLVSQAADFKGFIDGRGAPRPSAPLGALLTAQALRAPDAPAVTASNGLTTSRAELDSEANRRARHLAKDGVGLDDVVFISMPNGPDYYASVFAVWKLGATPAHVSERLTPREFDEIVELGRPSIVLGGPEDWRSGVRQAPGDWTPDPALSDAPHPPAAAHAWKISTSGGSTGRPKLILDPHAAVWSEDKQALRRAPDATIVNPGPLFHSAPFGLIIPAIAEGAHIIEMGRFDAERYLELVTRHKANWAFLVPTMMARIARLAPDVLARYDIASVQTLVHMAAPCPDLVKRFWINFLGPDVVWEIYGGTERIGSTVVSGRDWLERPGTVGRPRNGIKVRILDEDGAELPVGEVGEIYFRRGGGPASTFRYIGAEPRQHGDWASFGDMGRLDSDGFLYILDRRTDMIISGGINLYPAEIEAAIESIEGVISAVVVGLPDPDLGQRPHAVVQLDEPWLNKLDADDIGEALAERLSKMKRPRSIEITTQALRNDAGKVRRAEWRDACMKRLDGVRHPSA